MRIRIVRKFTSADVDVRSDRFQPGFEYEVDGTMASLFIAEGWAEAADPDGLGVRPADVERDLPSLTDAAAGDIAFDDAVAAVIERRARRER